MPAETPMPEPKDPRISPLMQEPLALLPRYAGALIPALTKGAAAGPAEAADGRPRGLGFAPTNARRGTARGVEVIAVYGFISHRMHDTGYFGGVSTEGLAAEIRRAIADPAVSTIVLDIDSPGGVVGGVGELADLIAGSPKRIIAVANDLAASAAYWIAAAAGEIVVSPSGEVGSIGIYTLHEDISRALEMQGVAVTPIFAGAHKVDGSPYAPLSEDARADLQAKVDTVYGMFLRSVARGRGVSASRAAADFGKGRTMLAKEAVAAGMADRVGTLDEVLARIASKGTSSGGASAMSAELAELELLASDSGAGLRSVARAEPKVKRAAIHEAGHALASIALGGKVNRIEIRPSDSGGTGEATHCMAYAQDLGFDSERDFGHYSVAVTLAGREAVAARHLSDAGRGCGSDERQVADMAAAWHPNDRAAASALVREAGRTVFGMALEPWWNAGIDALVAELLALPEGETTLPGPRVHEIVEAACGAGMVRWRRAHLWERRGEAAA